MPHDDDVERAIIGAAMFDVAAAQDAANSVAAADFYAPSHKAVYRSLVSILTAGQVPDLVSVANCLRTNGELETIGGASYLAAILDTVHTTANIGHYCGLLRDMSARRRLIRAAFRIAEAASSGGNVSDIIDKAEAAVCAIGSRRSSSGSRHVSSVLNSVFLTIERRYDGDDGTLVSTGIIELDQQLGGGFRESELVVVAGRPGMGKSALCGDIAAAVAGMQAKPVIVFTLEMSDSQLVQRLLGRQAHINGVRLQLGQIFDNEWANLQSTIGNMRRWPLVLNDSADMTPMLMRSECRRTVQDLGQLGLIVVDYIGLLDSDHGGGGGDNRVQEVSKITRALKKMAKEFKAPVMALSQLSRAVEGRTNKRPMLSDLRESGSIEQDADKVLFLYRDEYYNPESLERGKAEIIVAKHRSGPVGMVKVGYNAQLASFLPETSDFTPKPGHSDTSKRMPDNGHWTDV